MFCSKRILHYIVGTLSFYCRQHPTALLGHPNSCGKFYNCSKSGNSLKAKEDECLYPDLFSTTTKKCENFTDVVCDARKEPQEPCKKYRSLKFGTIQHRCVCNEVVISYLFKNV